MLSSVMNYCFTLNLSLRVTQYDIVEDCLLCMWYRGNISSRFSRNSHLFALEFLENLEEGIPV